MAPYLLMAAVVWRVQNLFTDRCAWTEVAPGLSVGRRCSFHQLPPMTSAVIDVTAEFPTPRSLRAVGRGLAVPTLDGCAPTWEQCRKITSFVDEAPAAVYYIFCANGSGRSVTYVAALLGHRQLARSSGDAIALIQKKRSVAAPNVDQRQFLEKAFKEDAISG
jgi:hypothetical protein